MTRRTAGFTLPEALIALTISSVLVLLVSTVFLVQNDFYSHILLRSQVQENARTMSELVGSEIRALASGSMIVADSSRLVARANIVTGLVCGTQGSDVIVYLPGGSTAFDTTDVAGFGYRNPSTGAWTYYSRTWSQLKQPGGVPGLQCALQGADTTGAISHFVRMDHIDSDTGVSGATLASSGSVIMLFRQTEFRFNNSLLVSGDRALFWGLYGQTLKEVVTGMSSDAHFEYRTGVNTWSKAIASGSLANVNGVRIVAQSIGKGETSQQATYSFGWSVDIPLANAY